MLQSAPRDHCFSSPVLFQHQMYNVLKEAPDNVSVTYQHGKALVASWYRLSRHTQHYACFTKTYHRSWVEVSAPSFLFSFSNLFFNHHCGYSVVPATRGYLNVAYFHCSSGKRGSTFGQGHPLSSRFLWGRNPASFSFTFTAGTRDVAAHRLAGSGGVWSYGVSCSTLNQTCC